MKIQTIAMRNLCLALALGALTSLGAPARAVQTGTGPDDRVSVHSSGTDVKKVLRDLFVEAKKNFVIEPGVYCAVYLELDSVEFDEALGILAHVANLKVTTRDGIYYVSADHPAKPVVTRTVPHAGATHASARPAAAHAPVRPAAASVAHGTDLTSAGLLQIKVKAHFAKTDIRSVFGELERLSKVNIVVDKAVPSYRLDVVLDHKSMLYALDRITKATGLVYKLDGHRVLIQTKSIAMH